ncbi:MAG TPA: di-heme oxidoredictase family protein, partial [Gemmataceae bacterium]|nr:di-heme oxidoredictase family protein [Gemmataceae bacterium]
PVADSGNPAEPLPVNRGVWDTAKKEKPPKFGAGAREWRTPPLWGLRHSAPYLHDGRADTVADAVALHGGEGLVAAQAFFRLTPRERQQVEFFLQSLTAPY